MFPCSHTFSLSVPILIKLITMFSSSCKVFFPCSLKTGSCSPVPFDVLAMFPCSPKPLGEPHLRLLTIIAKLNQRVFHSFMSMLFSVAVWLKFKQHILKNKVSTIERAFTHLGIAHLLRCCPTKFKGKKLPIERTIFFVSSSL